MTKQCRDCLQNLAEDMFYKTSRGKLASYCKRCSYKRSRRWKSNNQDRVKIHRRTEKLKANYGITQAEFDYLLDKQNGCCAICYKRAEKLCIDHCHETGVVRGLLCSPCNTGLGHFRDEIFLLESAIEYLKK